jgi:hypothetical protein
LWFKNNILAVGETNTLLAGEKGITVADGADCTELPATLVATTVKV